MVEKYNGIEIGDKVLITDLGYRYSTYRSMENIFSNRIKDIKPFIKIYNGLKDNKTTGIVKGFEQHEFENHKMLALVEIDNKSIIIGTKGIKKIDNEGENNMKNNKKLQNKVYFIVDASGSMSSDKMEVAKRIYEDYCSKYEFVVGINNTTIAEYAHRDDLFKSNSGGTYLSSGLSLAYMDSIKNGLDDCIFVQVCDGDNWSEDNDILKRLIEKLTKENKYVLYEIYPSTYTTTISTRIEKYKNDNIEINVFKNAYEAELKYPTTPKYKVQELKKEYTIYEIEHKVGGKLYDFRSYKQLRTNEMVICNTKHGNTYGKVKHIFIRKLTEKEYKEYATCIYV